MPIINESSPMTVATHDTAHGPKDKSINAPILNNRKVTEVSKETALQTIQDLSAGINNTSQLLHDLSKVAFKE